MTVINTKIYLLIDDLWRARGGRETSGRSRDQTAAVYHSVPLRLLFLRPLVAPLIVSAPIDRQFKMEINC
jgi:hypothetical protein